MEKKIYTINEYSTTMMNIIDVGSGTGDIVNLIHENYSNAYQSLQLI